MAAISCPKCNTLTVQAGYPAWVIIVAICLFPLGLLALLAGRKPTTCGNSASPGKHDAADVNDGSRLVLVVSAYG